MSDSNTTDDANLSELTDDDKLTSEYPPDEPLGVEEYGTTAREQAVQEPIDERVAREQPDVPLGATPSGGDDVGRLVAPDGDIGTDEVAESVASEASTGGEDRLDAGDLASGDSTTRDVAQERNGDLSAEEAAVHLTDPPPMGDGDGYLED